MLERVAGYSNGVQFMYDVVMTFEPMDAWWKIGVTEEFDSAVQGPRFSPIEQQPVSLMRHKGMRDAEVKAVPFSSWLSWHPEMKGVMAVNDALWEVGTQPADDWFALGHGARGFWFHFCLKMPKSLFSHTSQYWKDFVFAWIHFRRELFCRWLRQTYSFGRGKGLMLDAEYFKERKPLVIHNEFDVRYYAGKRADATGPNISDTALWEFFLALRDGKCQYSDITVARKLSASDVGTPKEIGFSKWEGRAGLDPLRECLVVQRKELLQGILDEFAVLKSVGAGLHGNILIGPCVFLHSKMWTSAAPDAEMDSQGRTEERARSKEFQDPDPENDWFVHFLFGPTHQHPEATYPFGTWFDEKWYRKEFKPYLACSTIAGLADLVIRANGVSHAGSVTCRGASVKNRPWDLPNMASRRNTEEEWKAGIRDYVPALGQNVLPFRGTNPLASPANLSSHSEWGNGGSGPNGPFAVWGADGDSQHSTTLSTAPDGCKMLHPGLYGQVSSPWNSDTGAFRYADLSGTILRKDNKTISRQLPTDNSMLMGMIVHSGDLVALGRKMKELRVARAEHDLSCYNWAKVLVELPKEQRIWECGRVSDSDGILGASLGPCTARLE